MCYRCLQKCAVFSPVRWNCICEWVQNHTIYCFDKSKWPIPYIIIEHVAERALEVSKKSSTRKWPRWFAYFKQCVLDPIFVLCFYTISNNLSLVAMSTDQGFQNHTIYSLDKSKWPIPYFTIEHVAERALEVIKKSSTRKWPRWFVYFKQCVLDPIFVLYFYTISNNLSLMAMSTV